MKAAALNDMVQQYQRIFAGKKALRRQLLRRFKLSRREQAVLIAVLVVPQPLTTMEVARRTRMAYAVKESYFKNRTA